MRTENQELEALNRHYARTVLAHLTYSQALGIFSALWKEARRLNPDFPGDWRNDIEADLELARVLNGLSTP